MSEQAPTRFSAATRPGAEAVSARQYSVSTPMQVTDPTVRDNPHIFQGAA